MIKLMIRDITIHDIVDFYQHVRALDKVEFELLSELRLDDARLVDLANAQALVDESDNVYAIGGVDDLFIWLLCTDRVEQNPITFLRACKRYFSTWIGNRSVTNFAWEQNTLHIKWLKWIGAVFIPNNTIKGFRQFVINNRKD